MDEENPPLYEKLIYTNEDKFFQVRLVVSEFRDSIYLHIRKYFLSFEGEYIPSKEGVSFPASMSNTYALLEGMVEICAKEENRTAITKYLQELLHEQDS